MYERYSYSCTESNVSYFKKIKGFKLANRHSLQLNLFDRIVTPILLYGCKAWGNENIDIIEKIYVIEIVF